MEEWKVGWEPAWNTIVTGETNWYLPVSKNSFPYVVSKMYNINILLVSWLRWFDQTGAVAFLLLLSRRIRALLFDVVAWCSCLCCRLISCSLQYSWRVAKKEAALFVQRQAVESIRGTSVSLHPLISNAGFFVTIKWYKSSWLLLTILKEDLLFFLVKV